MDRTGRVVIAPAFVDERDFFHGLAAVQVPEGKWGFIDETGKSSIPARFDEVRDFTDDLVPVRLGRKWGYIIQNKCIDRYGFSFCEACRLYNSFKAYEKFRPLWRD